MMFLFAAALNCTVNPPALRVNQLRAADGFQSIAVARSNLAASVLFKDGSVLRVTNMGCADSGSVAVLAVPDDGSEAKPNIETWRSRALSIARTAFDPTYAKDYAKWLSGAKLKTDDFTVSGETGDGYEDLSLDIRPCAFGTCATVSYTLHP
jgi:hypothetical protein